MQKPRDYTGIYENWNVDVDGDDNPDDPWDFGASRQHPVLKYGGHNIYRQGRPDPDPEPEEYVTRPIVYNLNIRFNVNGLTLDEQGLSILATNRHSGESRNPEIAPVKRCSSTQQRQNQRVSRK